ncbi:MAG TPA: hypothetical protein DHW34_02825 [Actinobacteria bacterium]|nr:hypothetical protein [Actinomycetota bacterium]
MRRPLWLALVWSVVAAVATTVAYAAITAVGSGLTPASDAAALQVSVPTSGSGDAAGGQRNSMTSATEPSVMSPSGEVAKPPRPRDRIDKERFRRLDDGAVGARGPGRSASYSTVGGTVVARCRAESVTLTAWSPAQGFRVAQVSRGPADGAEITFLSDANQVDLQVECSNGRPVFSVEAESADG